MGGLARLGFLANLLSRPMLVGFMTGIAFVMIASQLGKIIGTSLSGHEFAWQTGSFISHIDDVHWSMATLAAAVVALQIA